MTTASNTRVVLGALLLVSVHGSIHVIGQNASQDNRYKLLINQKRTLNNILRDVYKFGNLKLRFNTRMKRAKGKEGIDQEFYMYSSISKERK